MSPTALALLALISIHTPRTPNIGPTFEENLSTIQMASLHLRSLIVDGDPRSVITDLPPRCKWTVPKRRIFGSTSCSSSILKSGLIIIGTCKLFSKSLARMPNSKSLVLLNEFSQETNDRVVGRVQSHFLPGFGACVPRSTTKESCRGTNAFLVVARCDWISPVDKCVLG